MKKTLIGGILLAVVGLIGTAQAQAELDAATDADAALEAAISAAKEAAGDTSVNYAKVGGWIVEKDTDHCSLWSKDVLLIKRRDESAIAISFTPKTPMPLKDDEKITLRLAFTRLAASGVVEEPEQEFRVVDVGFVPMSIHGQVSLDVLDDFARYDAGGFVFGKSTVLQRIDLSNSAAAVSKLRACLAEIGA